MPNAKSRPTSGKGVGTQAVTGRLRLAAVQDVGRSHPARKTSVRPASLHTKVQASHTEDLEGVAEEEGMIPCM